MYGSPGILGEAGVETSYGSPQMARPASSHCSRHFVGEELYIDVFSSVTKILFEMSYCRHFNFV